MNVACRFAAAAVVLLAFACSSDRDRGPEGDAGPIGVDAGAVDAAAADTGAPGTDGAPVGDAGPPPVGSCLGACAGAAAPECPGFDRAACQEACGMEEDAAEAAGCTMEYRLYLGCQQSSGWGCDESGAPFTPFCDDQRAAWMACMGA